jgi:hypothetical protein
VLITSLSKYSLLSRKQVSDEYFIKSFAFVLNDTCPRYGTIYCAIKDVHKYGTGFTVGSKGQQLA